MQRIHLSWRESYSCGIESVDDQHRELIALINEFLDRLAADCPLKAMRYYLAAIHELIAAHFAEEEQIMREMNYSDARAHKIEHNRLIGQIRDVMDDVERTQGEMSKQHLAGVLDDWFSVHFRTADRAFHQLAESSSASDVIARRGGKTSA